LSVTGRIRQTALITGASSGIGRELAKVFAAEGHDLVLTARRRSALDDIASQLATRHGIRVAVLPRDLAVPGAANLLVRSIRRRKIEIDVLVNNAALMVNDDFSETPLESLDELMHVNVIAPTILTRMLLGPMLERGFGRILNVASMAGFQPIPRLAAYASSKSYLLHLTEALAEELVGSGVTATALCPGFTHTETLHRAPDLAALPPYFVGSAEQVAKDGYVACMNGTPVYVSGVANQLAAQVIHYQPRWLKRAIGGALARRNK
jgi:short-subunit dehydrogenase